ncbi:MAG: rRNA (cytidine1920-2-O)/16S rRNA (cytidine1409-2-O)-methyltransferase [Actinomycetota bacterium]|nr:rRNA (cytidine1920-2-O)/16S rRNA (cytidine1409-2-O)-methyltransferase [Actinomycetota bacterium]
MQIESGRVSVQGIATPSPATLVTPDAAITVDGPARRFVSRGGDKLDGALERFDVAVEGRLWLDAGASTGGFTDRLLQGGAAAVAAVDVGYGQLDWGLRNDPRVVVMERTNVRTLEAGDLPWSPDGVVADLSFISLRIVLPALASVANADADWVLLVKPQFEVGRDSLGRGGVVREPELWLRALDEVVASAEAEGLSLVAAAPSPLQGPAGNHEFFIHLRRGTPTNRDALNRAVEELA